MKRILFVSDLHCGSIYGLLPPGFERKDKNGRGYVGRRYLWDAWLEMCVATKGADIVVVNGDLVDGKQEAQRQTEMNLSDTSEQVDAAVQSLMQIRTKKGAPWYFVQGTEYHDGKGAPVVEEVAQRFSAVRPRPIDNVGSGTYSWEVLDLEVEPSVVINIQHGTSVGTGIYRATPYDREAIFSALAGKRGMVPKADCLVRAHAHFFMHLEHASKHVVALPCWELQTRFMRKNSAYRMLPDLGAVVIDCDGKIKEHGRDPIAVTKFIYPLPERKTVRAFA